MKKPETNKLSEEAKTNYELGYESDTDSYSFDFESYDESDGMSAQEEAYNPFDDENLFETPIEELKILAKLVDMHNATKKPLLMIEDVKRVPVKFSNPISQGDLPNLDPSLRKEFFPKKEAASTSSVKPIQSFGKVFSPEAMGSFDKVMKELPEKVFMKSEGKVVDAMRDLQASISIETSEEEALLALIAKQTTPMQFAQNPELKKTVSSLQALREDGLTKVHEGAKTEVAARHAYNQVVKNIKFTAKWRHKVKKRIQIRKALRKIEAYRALHDRDFNWTASQKAMFYIRSFALKNSAIVAGAASTLVVATTFALLTHFGITPIGAMLSKVFGMGSSIMWSALVIGLGALMIGAAVGLTVHFATKNVVKKSALPNPRGMDWKQTSSQALKGRKKMDTDDFRPKTYPDSIDETITNSVEETPKPKNQ